MIIFWFFQLVVDLIVLNSFEFGGYQARIGLFNDVIEGWFSDSVCFELLNYKSVGLNACGLLIGQSEGQPLVIVGFVLIGFYSTIICIVVLVVVVVCHCSFGGCVNANWKVEVKATASINRPFTDGMCCWFGCSNSAKAEKKPRPHTAIITRLTATQTNIIISTGLHHNAAMT